MDMDLDIFCPDDDVPCICRSCGSSQLNGGDCSHCFGCIRGEKAMDVCEAFEQLLKENRQVLERLKG